METFCLLEFLTQDDRMIVTLIAERDPMDHYHMIYAIVTMLLVAVSLYIIFVNNSFRCGLRVEIEVLSY